MDEQDKAALHLIIIAEICGFIAGLLVYHVFLA